MNECWLCGERGTPWPHALASIRRICPRCDVLWTIRPMIPGEVPTEVLHMGKAVPTVDFTRAGALSCPA